MVAAMVGRRVLLTLGRRRPKVEGRVVVDGIASQVTIARDAWGIPHISATSETDGWFGLGYCHAQDRAFQLEILVRAGRGTLAALLGEPGLPFDRLSLRLGFRRVGDAQLPMLDPEIRLAIEAYVQGINAGLSGTPRPHELVLLRARPTPWQAEDVLAFLALESFALAGNWDVELARLRILATDGPEALLAVDPVAWQVHSSPVGHEAAPALGRLATDLALLRGLVALGGASNAWALSGRRTKGGGPLLANDPHLAPSLPAPWYLAHLTTDAWQLAGASFVGGPAFPTGHNGHAAWGITAALSDGADLFLEEISVDGRSVRRGEGWEECRLIHEVVEVRGGRPAQEDVLITPRGPIISPIVDDASHALSLSAFWLRPGPVRGFLDTAAVRSFEDLRGAFADWAGPALGIAYADREGHIGWQMVGRLPQRRRGNGTIPLPGWDPSTGWEAEAVDFDALPCELDPPAGFVASANDQPRLDDDGPYLGVDWLDAYRAERIADRLAARDDWDVESCGRLQLDVESLPFRELRDRLDTLAPGSGAASRGLSMLRDWDGQVSADSPAATVFELLMAGLARRTASRLAPRGWRWSLGAGVGPALPRTLLTARSLSPLLARLRADPEGRRLRPGASEPGDISDELALVIEGLEAVHGPDSARWGWGRLRPLRLLHPLGRRPPLSRVFNLGPVPVGGDANTVAQASVHPLDPLGNPVAIANLRAVIDPAEPDRSRYVIAGGQSGNPLSPHYDDLFALWRRGEAVPIPWSPDLVERAAVSTLRLEPTPRPR